MDSFIPHLLYNNVPTSNLITPHKDKINDNTIWVQKIGQILILPVHSQHNSIDTLSLSVIVLVILNLEFEQRNIFHCKGEVRS